MIVRNKDNRFLLLFAWHGTILPRVLPTVSGVMALSTVAWLLSHYRLYPVTGVPAVGFTVFGVIISIFLGFRNSACYERWWEGRKLWGALVANTRHLSRDSHFLPPPAREALLNDMLLFVSLLRHRLRGTAPSETHLLPYGRSGSYSFLQYRQDPNPPQRILEHMQQKLITACQKGDISDIIYTSIQRHMIEMGNVQAGCDRIASTPLPFPYSVLLHRAVFCFCWALPFGLEPVMGIWTPFLVGFLSYLLLGLDELSHQLEDPFGADHHDLPLDTLVRMIERETLNLMARPLPEAATADRFYCYR
ncbi:bestrophin family protein [Neisseria leonii]|uniref:Bestrophin family protein n=1 Tax=Neisseria leonii TaxID=2995413 RepID=A0A9X4E183_9NEIS|nr:bestrophin family protein [Neisseria sp. 51.81]MDD9327603.1 bestrophin family protein [Neisseria sp. 51.81]